MSLRRAAVFVALGIVVAVALLVAGAKTTTPIDFAVGEPSGPNPLDPTPPPHRR